MSAADEKVFKQMVADSGLPLTEDQAAQKWREAADEANSPFNNDSAHSPFWRVITALVTTPVLWLVKDLLLKAVLPNLFLRTATGPFVDLFGWAFDLERKQEAKARGVLTFSRIDTAGAVTIPANTVVQSPVINGRVYSVKTLTAATLQDGQASIAVNIEALEAGAGYNLPAGYYAVLPQAVPGIDAVTNGADWLTSAGADEEKDDDYKLRIRNQFTAVNQYHTDAVYTKIITSFANINTRNVYFEHNAPRGPGTANAYILMDVGQPSAELLDAIEQHVMDDGNHGHGDDLRVFALPEVLYDLTVTVRAKPDATDEEWLELLADVEGATACAFRENDQYQVTVTQPWSTFSFSKLGGELHTLFPLLDDVKFNLSEIVSELNIPRLNSLTVVEDA